MKENQKKAFDFASDTTKQLITIATAIITLTVTFSKDIIGGIDDAPKTLLVVTWAFYIVSIFFGVLTLMTLTGTLQPLAKWKAYKTHQQNQQPNPHQGQGNQGTPVPSVQTPDDDCTEININNSNIRLLSGLQALTFIIAIVLTGCFGYKSLSEGNKSSKYNENYTVIRRTTLNNDTSKVYVDTLFIEK